MLEGVTIDQLRALRAVAETGSFSAAARKLGRVQAAVSQAIDRLEAQLGLRLFDRTGRTPKLTSHGEAVVAAAGAVHDDLDALDDVVASLKRGRETRLSIVVDSMFPTDALVDFAREFGKEHPSVELVLLSETLSAVTTLVRERRALLGIAGDEADRRGLEQRRIAEITMIPVVAKSHPLARVSGAIERSALANTVQIVLSERGAPRDAGEGSADHGVLSSRTWRVVDLATKQALIAAGLGWGHLPEHAIRDELRARRLVPLRLDAWGGTYPRRILHLVWRRGGRLGPVAQWVETRLTSLCRAATESTHHTT